MNINIKGYNFLIKNEEDGHNGKFWPMVVNNQWENFTFNCVQNNKGYMFWDFGGFIGPISLYASMFFDKVISWEPDIVSYNIFKDHIRDNNIENIILNSEGIYREETMLSLGSGKMPLGGSCSSINHSNNTIEIKTTTIDSCIKKYGIPDFVKIDIEGGEEYIIDDLIKYKFKNIHLSNHFEFITNLDLYKNKLLQLEKLYIIYNNNNQITTKLENGEFFLKLKI